MGRRADFDAALKLEPKMREALVEKAKLQTEGDDFAGAIASYTAALESSPGDADLLAGRGIAYARSGDATRAEKDFAEARAKAAQPSTLNNICWSKATAGVALESALADCNEALSKAADVAGYLDSRGLVLLRLGRFDDAIADYNRVLAKNPDMPSSLFGRAVAWARKGEKGKSDTDAAAAMKADADVRDEFERFGIKL